MATNDRAMTEHLAEQLRAAELETATLGERLLVLPAGGRVIALCPREDENVLWVNPVVMDSGRLTGLLQSSEWVNLGGDRTWISPEVETHIGDPTRMAQTYSVPKRVDPGNYVIAGQGKTSARLTAEMTVRFHRADGDVPLRLSKTISSLETPPVTTPDSVAFAGYSLQTNLEALGALLPNAHPAIWNLLQVPRGGRIYAPVRGAATPRAFIGQPTWGSSDGLIQMEAQTDRPMKLSIHARDSTGSLIYLRAKAQYATLIVRRFAVEPSPRYFDAPCDDLSDVGYMAQMYVDDGGLGDFAELEYHSPGLDASAGIHGVTDTSEVLAFVGPMPQVSELCEYLLQRPIAPPRQALIPENAKDDSGG